MLWVEDCQIFRMRGRHIRRTQAIKRRHWSNNNCAADHVRHAFTKRSVVPRTA